MGDSTGTVRAAPSLDAAPLAASGSLWRVDITDESGRLVAHGEVRLQNVVGWS